MNVTLADAEEVWLKKDHKRVELGRILLKGDNIVSGVSIVLVDSLQS
jgi:small nuclear ribonucleoprotein (snRNP)-like protein